MLFEMSGITEGVRIRIGVSVRIRVGVRVEDYCYAGVLEASDTHSLTVQIHL